MVDKFCFNVLESQYDLVKVLLKSLMVFLWQFFFGNETVGIRSV